MAMHTAVVSDSDTLRLETVLTARASREQLQSVWASMEQPDALSSPGPTRVINVALSSGQRASVVFHERHDILEILAPLETNVEAGLADALAELGIASDAITWTHARIDRAALTGAAIYAVSRST
jgi:hypothetical protein